VRNASAGATIRPERKTQESLGFTQKAAKLRRWQPPGSIAEAFLIVLTPGFWQAILRGGLGAGRHPRAIPIAPAGQSRDHAAEDDGIVSPGRPSSVRGGCRGLSLCPSRA
jgi:hypothetical protein